MPVWPAGAKAWLAVIRAGAYGGAGQVAMSAYQVTAAGSGSGRGMPGVPPVRPIRPIPVGMLNVARPVQTIANRHPRLALSVTGMVWVLRLGVAMVGWPSFSAHRGDGEVAAAGVDGGDDLADGGVAVLPCVVVDDVAQRAPYVVVGKAGVVEVRGQFQHVE